MFALARMNRLGRVALLPMMVLAILGVSRLNFDRSAATAPAVGTLVVASLRGESLGFHDFAGIGTERSLSLAGPPHELAVADGRVYATLGRGDQLVEVEPRAPGVMRTLHLDGTPHGLALSGANLLVTLDDADAMVTVARDSFAEGSRTPTGHTPHTVATDGTHVYITDARDNQLRMLAETPLLGDTGRMPESVAIAGDFAVTADSEGGTVSIFRRGTMELAGRISIGGHPVRVVTLDATHVAVALNGAASVAVIDLAKMRVTRHTDVLPQPDGICLSADGAFVAVVSNATDSAQVFRATDWKLALTLPTADGPGSCAWLP